MKCNITIPKVLFCFFLLILLVIGSIYYFDQQNERTVHYHIPDLVNCKSEAPFGWPYIEKANSTYLCRTGYGLMHDNVAKISKWVTYTLTPSEAIGCTPRSNSFVGDPNIPSGEKAEVSDYLRSGYDMGHLANAADMSWSPKAEKESFYLSNVAPQIPGFNRGIWKDLETDIRNLSYNKNTNITVYTGPVYSNSEKFIGKNKIAIPTAYYKIVINNSNKKSYAFLFNHVNTVNKDYSKYQTTVARIEEETGIDFPIPDNKNSMNKLWINGKSIINTIKRIQCQI